MSRITRDRKDFEAWWKTQLDSERLHSSSIVKGALLRGWMGKCAELNRQMDQPHHGHDSEAGLGAQNATALEALTTFRDSALGRLLEKK